MIGDTDQLLIQLLNRASISPKVDAAFSHASQEVSAVSQSAAPFSGQDRIVASTVSTPMVIIRRIPFEVYYDCIRKQWGMHLPVQALYVGGETVALEPPDSFETPTIYLHVNTYKDIPEAVINNQKEDPSYDVHIAVCTMKQEKYGWTLDKQLLSGTLYIQKTPTSCFDVEFQGGTPVAVRLPYVMCGRQVIEAAGTPSNGINVVRVEHSADSVTATIETGEAAPDNSSDTETIIPLYKIEDGKIIEDYRNMLRVPLYDPVGSG